MADDTTIQDLKKMLDDMRESAVKAKENPRDYSPNTVSAYYQQTYAEEVKVILDSMNPGKDKLIRCGVLGVKYTTVRAKVYQAWQYLTDHMDPDGKYKELRDRISLVPWPSHGTKEGVVIHWGNSRTKKSAPLTSEDILPLDEIYSWKDKLDRFMENAVEREVIELTDLGLSEEEFIALKQSIEMTDDFVWAPKNTKNKITIMRDSMLRKL